MPCVRLVIAADVAERFPDTRVRLVFASGLAGAADWLEESTEDVTVRFARAGDRFVPLGEPDTVEEPSLGEVVYAQGAEVLTRHWNHRDCDRTKLTAASTRAVVMLERVSAAAVGDD